MNDDFDHIADLLAEVRRLLDEIEHRARGLATTEGDECPPTTTT